MKSYRHQPLNPSHKIPGDNPALDKFDPDQDKHRPYLPIHPRDERPSYLTEKEWDEIKIQDGDMRERTEWNGQCQGNCCKEGY